MTFKLATVIHISGLYALDDSCSLSVQLCSVPVVRLLLALSRHHVSQELSIKPNKPPLWTLVGRRGRRRNAYVFQTGALMVL